MSFSEGTRAQATPSKRWALAASKRSCWTPGSFILRHNRLTRGKGSYDVKHPEQNMWLLVWLSTRD